MVCDSRGRKVLPLLDNPDIMCWYYPGATLKGILPRLQELILRYQPISCLIALGINDLTYWDRILRYVYPRIRSIWLTL